MSEQESHPEHQRMVRDIEAHGSLVEGTYRNVPYLMKRPHDTFWCGYVEECNATREISDQKLEALEDIAHGGLTAHLGFDCAHSGDYAPLRIRRSLPWGTYRDYDYVLANLKAMIDCILDTQAAS